MSQLPLALGGLGPPDFAHFWSDDDSLVVARLQALARAPGASAVRLCGPPSSGKTHLLLATCEAARSAGVSVSYLPLQRIPMEALGEPIDADLLVIDDADLALSDLDAAHALFALINRLHDRRSAWLLAARNSDSVLPDLASRLARAEQLRLATRSDHARRAILLHRAERAGIPLDTAAVDYLLRHGSRDLRELMAQLAALDRAALARATRITVPLIRREMAEKPSN